MYCQTFNELLMNSWCNFNKNLTTDTIAGVAIKLSPMKV